jgi:uncharacterized repeat protein (TIGR01451 family)
VTLETPSGTNLVGVQAIANPSPADTPTDVDFPFGFFSFRVVGLPPEGATTVTMDLPFPLTGDFRYYKYGPTYLDWSPHWYDFSYDHFVRTGAKTHFDDPQIPDNQVVLYFVDEEIGDDSREHIRPDGIITDPGSLGAPAADLSLSQAVTSATPIVGKNLTFTLTVTNNSSISATGVTLTDTLPAGFLLNSVSAGQGSWTSAGGVVLYSLGTLDPGAIATVLFRVKATATGPLTNIARVTSDLFDRSTSNDIATTTINVQTVTTDRRTRFVTVLYHEMLGRDPLPRGLRYWYTRLAAGAPPVSVARAIWRSHEHRSLRHQHLAPPIRSRRALADALRAKRFDTQSVSSHTAGPLHRSRPAIKSWSPGLS